MDHPFRSAAFGGFNRQDVLDYLEKTAAENAESSRSFSGAWRRRRRTGGSWPLRSRTRRSV